MKKLRDEVSLSIEIAFRMMRPPAVGCQLEFAFSVRTLNFRKGSTHPSAKSNSRTIDAAIMGVPRALDVVLALENVNVCNPLSICR